MDPEESVGQDPAFEKPPELSFDEPRRWAIAVTRAGQERLELFGDDLVQDGFVGPAGSVGGRGNASGTRGSGRNHDVAAGTW
jgi:hypothetical protein